MNILIFPGGSEIGLEINKALRYHKDINLFAANLDNNSHFSYVFKNISFLPSIKDKSFFEKLNKLIVKWKIDYIIPAYDDIIEFFALHEDKIMTNVISSPKETCIITRSKKLTYDLFKDFEFCPEVYKDNIEYPCFLKPDKGQGSQKVYLCENSKKLYGILKKYGNIEFIKCEYLPGEEYTIDCFSDREEGLIFVSGRKRIKILNGICTSSRLVESDLQIKFKEIADKISSKIKFYGAWFFQLKKDKFGNFKLLEIAARIAGTSALTRAYGINLSLLNIYEANRIKVNLLKYNYNIEINRALVNRYKIDIKYNRVYIDLDDTIIFKDTINPYVMMFLYQCKNKEIDIYLITRNINFINILENYNIPVKLFKDLIFVPSNKLKSIFIDKEGSIFIDDSFKEKKDVYINLNIPVFGLEQLDLLIDWRS